MISLEEYCCSGSKRVLQQASISSQMLPNATLEIFHAIISSCLAPSALKPGLILSHYFMISLTWHMKFWSNRKYMTVSFLLLTIISSCSVSCGTCYMWLPAAVMITKGIIEALSVLITQEPYLVLFSASFLTRSWSTGVAMLEGAFE